MLIVAIIQAEATQHFGPVTKENEIYLKYAVCAVGHYKRIWHFPLLPHLTKSPRAPM